MATNRRAFFLFLFLSCFLFPLLLSAQESAQEDGQRLVQRLAWRGDLYAMRYEVLIEREYEDGFVIVLWEYTEMSYIDISLPPGRYRLRITPYNYLDWPGDESEMFFEVRPAHIPVLDETPPEAEYGDGVYVLNISGNNLDPAAEMYLQRPGGEPVVPVEVIVNEDGRGARLVFAKDDLPPGDYDLVIVNPGGLETRSEGIAVEYPEPEWIMRERLAEINFTAAWIPLFPIYGEGFGQSMIALPGAAARLGVLSLNTDPFAAGFELTASWYSFDKKIEDEETVLQALLLGVNLMARMILPNPAASLIFRVGAGYSLLLGEETSGFLADNIFTNIGVSFRWIALGTLYFEIGLDYTHLLTKIPSGGLRPWIGLGVAF